MKNIVNIVNFIRACEPRNPELDLVRPVREQIALMKKHRLPGTFLMQYDAMLREDMLELIRPLDPEQFEKGVWLEMNKPHALAAGLPWRGRKGFDWDWHANVGFSVGYTPEEREKLIDVLFEKFRSLFGAYPKSCGSWMIDAHALMYMRERYGVEASCICKDQWGTDGYTIWGGYWNQAYYPSRRNALCPAQTREAQIDLPVFRMLGSDPVSQYDLGLSLESGASECQSVETLEPVYKRGGGDPNWVEWFMRQNMVCPLAFSYAQAGQENSFGWPSMEAGLICQFALFERLREAGKLRVETLGASGRWFRETFPLTPAAAVCALEPYGAREAQSVWYDCRTYRANLYRDARGLRLRDLYLFDERRPERYLTEKCVTEYLVYDNLPVIDGNRHSGGGVLAGGFLAKDGPLSVKEEGTSLAAVFPGGEILFDERGVTLKGGVSVTLQCDWTRSALREVEDTRLCFEYQGTRYTLEVEGGRCSRTADGVSLVPDGDVMRLLPRRSIT